MLEDKREIYLKIKVIPNAAKTEFKEMMEDGTFKISVAAAPEKNKANAVLTQFLKEKFFVDKEDIAIISGHSSRSKLVKIVKK